MEKKLRALVVEDDFSWQQLLQEILTDMGLEVDTASNREEAAGTIHLQPHRLAILDLSLGGTDHHNQDGLAVAELVRRNDPGCAIIFLTGYATVELAVKVMRDINAVTCLRKEIFRRSEFRNVVREALVQPAPAMLPESIGAAGTLFEEEKEPARSLALIVEDDAGWRSVLSELLQDTGYEARVSSSYVEAIGLLRREKPALAVIDLSLASSMLSDNLDGYRLLTSMQRAGVPAIIVSGYVDPARIEQAYNDGLIVACPENSHLIENRFARRLSRQAGAQGDPVLKTLTDREREVLELIARGMTNKEIARELTITPNTVKRHLKSLFVKLNVSTRSAASARAIEMRLGRE